LAAEFKEQPLEIQILSQNKNILILVLATIFAVVGMDMYSKIQRGWRREIDGIIERKLEAAGFQKFDGIAYSFPISNEVLGLVQIYNQELFKYPDPNRAIINTRLGIIDYQLNVLESRFDSDDRYGCKLGDWTLGSPYRNDSGVFIEMFDLYRSQSLSEKEAAIDKLIERIRVESIPKLRANLKTLPDIANLLAANKHSNRRLYCMALAASGKVAEARDLSNAIAENPRATPVNPAFWSQFKSKFDRWIADGAVVPNLDQSRVEVMKAAEARKQTMSNIPVEDRPTF
jgi:hypothetical protein